MWWNTEHSYYWLCTEHITMSIVQVFVFGVVFEWAHFYNKYVYVVIWILNGLLQSTGWPTVVAIMGNWFGRYRYRFFTLILGQAIVISIH